MFGKVVDVSRLMLLRHAETVPLWRDMSYDDLVKYLRHDLVVGIDQVGLLRSLDKKELRSLGIDRILTSSLRRAVETGAVLGKVVGVRPRVLEGVEEVSFKSLPRRVFDGGGNVIRNFLQGESMKKKDRVDLGVFEKFRDKNTLVVSHGLLMINIYEARFGRVTSFREYLTGFDFDSGEFFGLRKEGLQ